MPSFSRNFTQPSTTIPSPSRYELRITRPVRHSTPPHLIGQVQMHRNAFHSRRPHIA